MQLKPMLAQVDTTFPSDGSSAVVWAIVAAVILGLYFLLRTTRRRATRDYWNRQRRDEEMRRNDPDMKPED